jgi:hypothetical protein
MQGGGSSPFIDHEGYRNHVENRVRAFRAALARQKGTGGR